MGAEICLGTAQLGLEYGVNNTAGKPDLNRAFDILDTAWAQGIRSFDTAALYGDSESVLKAWIQARQVGQDIRIITKLPGLPEGDSSFLQDWILSQAGERLEALGHAQVEGILLHRGADMLKPGVVEGLRSLVTAGITKHVGISTYHPQEGEQALEAGLDMVQITYSIFDRRFEKSGFLKAAKDKNVKIYARSPFLQGLLLMPLNQLPSPMGFARGSLERWHRGLEDLQEPPLRAALQYCIHQPEIDYVVLGVETPLQLVEIMNTLDVNTDIAGLNTLAASLEPIEERIVLPYMWGNQ